MTSPDRSVPSGAYSGTAGAADSLPSLQAVTWAGAQASILSSVLGSFASLSAAGTTLNSGTTQALSTAGAAASTAAGAQSTAQSTQSVAAANAAQIAAMTAQQTSQGTGGVSFSDSFTRSTLGPGYTVFSSGQVAGLVVAGGQVELNQTGDESSGSVVALSTTTLATDNQSVSIVLGAANQASNAAVDIYVRAAVDLSTFVYAGIRSGSVYLGYGTRSGGVTSYNGWTSGPATAATGDTVTVTAVGAAYEVQINGIPVLGYTDSGQVSPVGAANRSFGFDGEYVWTGLFGYFGFAVAGLSAADLASPTGATGTGWSLMRLNSTGAAQPKGESPVQAGTFDTISASAGVTVSSLSLGAVEVPQSGWYLIDATFYLSGQDTQIRADLWEAANLGGPWSMLRAGATTNQISAEFDGSGNETDVGQVTSVAGSFVVYLTGGTFVAPGLKLNVANTVIGPNTHFDGSLLNY